MVDIVSLTNLPLLTSLFGSETRKINHSHICVDNLVQGVSSGNQENVPYVSLDTIYDDLSCSALKSITAFLMIIFPLGCCK